MFHTSHTLTIQKFSLRISIFLLSLIWCLGIISVCVKSEYLNSFYLYLNQLYSTMCHQSYLKSFHFDAKFLLVCARCSGIYFGVLTSSFVLLFIKSQFSISTRLLILFSLPMLADVAFYSVGIYDYNKFTAAVTGILFGSAVFIYILSAVENSLFKNSYSK